MPHKAPTLDAMLFDFDGTLATLTIDFARLRRKITALAEPFLGEEPEPSELPVLEWLDELAAEIRGFDQALGLEFHCRGRLVIQATELDAAREATLFPFTRPLLAGLRASGVKTGILTRNSTAAVKVVFPDVQACCDAFMAREDAPRVKPDPAHALALLTRLGVARERALLVGDHPLDIQAARGAGLVSAAVASGHSTREALAAAGPDFLAADCAELMGLVREQFALPSSFW
ncbi:MAG: HAD family hydrolase [Humidesulfovibrio sp.]|nr:haloacid dehalogenase [Desulfovibrio sp.]MDO9081861.1 HAD family hydrolase [Humidesulfovibrio sp.]